MTTEAKKAKILAAIAARGWFTCDCYYAEAKELCAAGTIKIGTRCSAVGARSIVWVAA